MSSQSPRLTHEGAAPEKLAADWLVCPKCSGPLAGSDKAIACSRCSLEWPVVNGVPHFVTDFPYWGEIPLQQMREVNAAARSHWKLALTDSQDPAVLQASRMILNLDRANWHWLTGMPTDSRVLDIGAGTGTNSHALGLRYREVVAVEPVAERTEFMRHRFAQEKLDNVRVVRSSVWTLPFAPGSFDLIAMNGVLEWVALGVAGDPGELQQRALANAWRLLRPGGCLYLGIENRYCPGYFVGHNDPHCGLPFVTILPRPLASWYARRKGAAAGYRNYLYSSRGYRNLLQKTGFSRVDIYAAIPSYNDPRFLTPLDGPEFGHYARTFADSSASSPLRRLLKNTLLKSGLMPHMTYAFAIMAHK